MGQARVTNALDVREQKLPLSRTLESVLLAGPFACSASWSIHLSYLQYNH
jgi:hypothetical protein